MISRGTSQYLFKKGIINIATTKFNDVNISDVIYNVSIQWNLYVSQFNRYYSKTCLNIGLAET